MITVRPTSQLGEETAADCSAEAGSSVELNLNHSVNKIAHRVASQFHRSHLSLPSTALLATSAVRGSVADSGSITLESYTAAGNFFAFGPLVNNVMELGYLLELPDGSMDAGLTSLKVATP